MIHRILFLTVAGTTTKTLSYKSGLTFKNISCVLLNYAFASFWSSFEIKEKFSGYSAINNCSACTIWAAVLAARVRYKISLSKQQTAQSRKPKIKSGFVSSGAKIFGRKMIYYLLYAELPWKLKFHCCS